MNKKNILIVSIVVVIAVLGFMAYQTSCRKKSGSSRIARDRNRSSLNGAIYPMTVDASGSLVPRTEIGLAFTTGGRVAETFL